jgi:hypothetical protein
MFLEVRLKKRHLVFINTHKSIINSGQKQSLTNKERTAEQPWVSLRGLNRSKKSLYSESKGCVTVVRDRDIW